MLQAVNSEHLSIKSYGREILKLWITQLLQSVSTDLIRSTANRRSRMLDLVPGIFSKPLRATDADVT